MEIRSKKDLMFSLEEDELLFSLVLQHRNIIKFTEANGWRGRQGIWRKIATLLEEKTGKVRSVRSIQNRYSYLKHKLRKKIVTENSWTGDVPPHFMKLTSDEEQLFHVWKENVAVMGNHFDDDPLDVHNTTPFTEDEDVTVNLNEGVILESVGQQTGIQTVKAGKSRDIESPEAENILPGPSYQHQRKRETVTAQELAKAKFDFLESEKRIKSERHESKKQIKLEEHKLKQAIRQAELDLLQAKLKLVIAQTKEIEEKENKCDECK